MAHEPPWPPETIRKPGRVCSDCATRHLFHICHRERCGPAFPPTPQRATAKELYQIGKLLPPNNVFFCPSTNFYPPPTIARVRRPSALRASNAPSHRTRLVDWRTHRSEHAPRCPFRPCPLATVPLRVPLVMKIRIAYLPHRRRDILPTHCSFGRIVGRIGVRYLRDRSDHATASTRSCQN